MPPSSGFHTPQDLSPAIKRSDSWGRQNVPPVLKILSLKCFVYFHLPGHDRIKTSPTETQSPGIQTDNGPLLSQVMQDDITDVIWVSNNSVPYGGTGKRVILAMPENKECNYPHMFALKQEERSALASTIRRETDINRAMGRGVGMISWENQLTQNLFYTKLSLNQEWTRGHNC